MGIAKSRARSRCEPGKISRMVAEPIFGLRYRFWISGMHYIPRDGVETRLEAIRLPAPRQAKPAARSNDCKMGFLFAEIFGRLKGTGISCIPSRMISVCSPMRVPASICKTETRIHRYFSTFLMKPPTARRLAGIGTAYFVGQLYKVTTLPNAICSNSSDGSARAIANP